jgi:hypothetical protein
MRFDAIHKGYGIRIRKGERLYALIFRPGYTRPLKDIPAAEEGEGQDVLLERAQQVIERDLKPHQP